MKRPFFTGFVGMALAGTLLAQQPANSSFKGLGNTALDRKPPSAMSRSKSVPGAPGVVPGAGAAPVRVGTGGGQDVTIPAPNAPGLFALGPTRSLNFEAKSVGAGGDTDKSNRYGGNVTTREQSPSLRIDARNLGQLAEQTHFDWFFVAKSMGNNRLFVWDRGETELAVPSRGQAQTTAESKPLLRRTTQSSFSSTFNGVTTTSGYQSREGAVPHGWVVRMWVDGRVAQIRASSAELERLGRDASQLGGAPPVEGRQ